MQVRALPPGRHPDVPVRSRGGRRLAAPGGAGYDDPPLLEAEVEERGEREGAEASLLQAGLAAYYEIVDGALALVRRERPGRYVNVTV